MAISYTAQAANRQNISFASRIFNVGSAEPLGAKPEGRAHFVISWCISMPPAVKPTLQPRFIWSKANFDAIAKTISAHNWNEIFTSLASADDCYNEFVRLYMTSKAFSPSSAPCDRAQTLSTRQIRCGRQVLQGGGVQRVQGCGQTC